MGLEFPSCFDADQIEVRWDGAVPHIVALLELTCFDGEGWPNEEYFKSILHDRRYQIAVVRKLAQGVRAYSYYVLFKKDMEWLWVHDLTAGDRRWEMMKLETYEKWLRADCKPWKTSNWDAYLNRLKSLHAVGED